MQSSSAQLMSLSLMSPLAIDAPNYQQLDLGKNQIRVLTLHPGL